MPASLDVSDLTVSRGAQLVLDAVTVRVAEGQRVGVVGPNGVGKSTLLGALAGTVPIERGRVLITPLSATIGVLPQEPQRRDGETGLAFLARRTGVAAARAELDAATRDLAAGAPLAGDRYSEAFERWMALGAADFEARLGEVLADLGLPEALLGQPTATLSGGQAARLALASLVLSRFDLYLLDEPTNDVDLAGLEHLERWVTGLGAPVVLVSHDRRFLENVVTDVLEIDEFSHQATLFAGGWAAYQEERATARRHAWERFAGYDTKRKALAGRAQREREWASQGRSRATRSPQDNDKFVRNWKIDQTEQLAARAARTERAIDRLEVVDKPREPWQLRLAIGSPGRSGDIVARLDGAVAERGSFTLGPIDLHIGYGERVGVVGANGAGKSTLLAVLLGRRVLAGGERWFGPGVVVGEIEQVRAQLAADRPLVRVFTDVTGQTVAEVRTLLAKFGLTGEHVERTASTLSPGERTRAVLALLVATGANCLVLDEPTNHLDLPAIEQLEAALEQFPGTVILVTHDRALLDHVRLTRLVRLDAGRIVADAPV